MNIFLSYSHSDKYIADKVEEHLNVNDIGTFVGYNTNIINNNLFNELRYNIKKSDYIIIFLSKKFFESKYSMLELSEAVNEFKMRKINIIPLVIEKCSIPTYILEFDVIDFTKSFDKGMIKLKDRLSLHQKINLENINSITFEKVVKIFLKEYGFNVIRTNQSFDRGFDFVCEYYAKDPFGNKTKETWLVESKHYKNDRFSIINLQKLYKNMKTTFPNISKLLMITNNILNSAAMEYLDRMKRDTLIDIIVIDGPTFERLIYKRKRLSKRVEEVLYASSK